VPIEGKVAQILNALEVVLNRGSADGVEREMTFAIYDPKAFNIRDPDTNVVLGSVLRPKVRVRVVDVEEHLSVAQTYETRRRNIGGSGIAIPDFASLITAPKYVERPVTLRSDEALWEDLSESQSFVKIGDPVRQLSSATDVGTAAAAPAEIDADEAGPE
jgi:hypothetical protein